MHFRKRLSALLMASLLLCRAGAGLPANAQEASSALLPSGPLHEKVLRLPGDPARPVMLEVTLYTPPGAGPFPLAVLNHGATRASKTNRGSRYRFTFSAYYFLSRGYAVALPMARGFAGSDGDMVHEGCDLARTGLENARDVAAVIGALGQRPDIDRARVVVGGQSFGGWTTMALGTLEVPGVRGLAGFSPALRASDCGWQDQAMITGARALGTRARHPSIWFYGDNDTIMPVSLWRVLFAAYAHGGSNAELVSVGRFMEDSHQLLSFPEGLPLWAPKMDTFLKRIGLPSTLVHPGYMPTPPPPASHFAAIADAAALPGLNDKGREAYRQFLTLREPRAFVLAPGGQSASATGGFDPLARALKLCEGAGFPCRPYAVDSRVVWTGGAAPPASAKASPSSAPIPSEHAITVAAGRTTPLNFSSDIRPDCGVRGVPVLRVSQTPGHGTVSVRSVHGHPRFPPGHPLAACVTALVQGSELAYTPAPGYTGADILTFERTSADGERRVFRITLTVK